MRDGQPSVTAQRVAAHRLGFDRLVTPFGHPSADEALAADVADDVPALTSDLTVRYLRARTAFFDRVVVNAIGRDVSQIVLIGAGYDGRPLRYAREGLSWWEIDHPDTQADKRARLDRLGLATPDITFVARDLESEGLAAALAGSGFDADAPSLLCCEGVAAYLTGDALERLLTEVRSLAAPGTRLALSLSITPASEDAVDRRERLRDRLAALGEPIVSSLVAEEALEVFTRTRWRRVKTSERSERAGLVVAAPIWSPAPGSAPASAGAHARFMEGMTYRPDAGGLGGHLEEVYGVAVTRTRELDLGVHRVERADRSEWIARMSPIARSRESVAADAELLGWLEECHFSVERCAAPGSVSTYEGQSVLVTEFVKGKKVPSGPKGFEQLAELLGRLHSLAPGCVAARRPGGAWHHLLPDGTPSDELVALASLLRHASGRVPPGQGGPYDELVGRLGLLDGCSDLLLWAASASGRSAVEAVGAGYREIVALEPEEVDRLEQAMRIRPFVLACWTFATGRAPLSEVVDRWQREEKRIESAAVTARRALTAASE